MRHLDAHTPDQGPASRSQCRRITLLWYLNPGWCPSWGGQLRAYPQSRHAPRFGTDVEPLLDRVLVFRSDLVEHEVLPSAASRCAVTVWLYGDGAPGVPHLPRLAPAPRPPPCAQDEDRILLSIVSYRDPGLGRTIAAALAAAAAPQRLAIGAYVQASLPQDERCVPDAALAETARSFGAALRLRVEPADEAAGPAVARARARSLWRQEPYVLQVDAHTRFAPGWDRVLLAQLRACDSPRAVLTAYPTDFERGSPASDPALEVRRRGAAPPPSSLRGRPTVASTPLMPQFPRDAGATLLLPDRFDDDGMLRWRGKRLRTCAKPLRSPGWAAGFHFGPSAAFLHVRCRCRPPPVATAARADAGHRRRRAQLPYVESLRWLFFGEEALAAACLWTRGWDLFAPSEPVLAHAWSRAERPSCWEQVRRSHPFRCHTDAGARGQVSDAAKAEARHARERVRAVLAGEGDPESEVALGDERPLPDLERFLQVSFRDCAVLRSGPDPEEVL